MQIGRGEGEFEQKNAKKTKGSEKTRELYFQGPDGVKSRPVHPLYEKADRLSHHMIGAAIEVHRDKGPGLIESIYERCLLRELDLRKIELTTQQFVRIEYKGLIFDQPLRYDLLADRCLLVELKAVEAITAVHKAQLLSYMKLLNVPIGLLINFHEPMLKNGIVRMILPGASGERSVPDVSL